MAARTPANGGFAPTAYEPRGTTAVIGLVTASAFFGVPFSPTTSVQYFATMADGDTWTLPNWTAPLPSRAWVKPDTTSTAASVEWAMSGTSLVFTFRTDGATTGYLCIEQ